MTLRARNICSFQVERRIKTEFILRKEKRFYFFGYTLLLTDNGYVKARTKDAPGYFSLSPQKLHHSGAPARAKRARSGAPWVTKFGKLSIR